MVCPSSHIRSTATKWSILPANGPVRGVQGGLSVDHRAPRVHTRNRGVNGARAHNDHQPRQPRRLAQPVGDRNHHDRGKCE